MTTSSHDLLSLALPNPDRAVLHTWRSALFLTPSASRAGRDAYVLHQLVERGLGTVKTTGDRHGRILFTAARTPARSHPANGLTLEAGNPHTLLAQTPSPSDWAPLKTSMAISRWETQEVHQVWQTGDSAEIRAVASPLVTKNTDANSRYHVPLIDPAEAGAWLSTRLRKAGCQLKNHDVTLGTLERTRRRQSSLYLQEFQATVTVTDPHAFVALLAAGLGRNRAWGAGLVLARKVKGSQDTPNGPAQKESSPCARG